MVCQSTTATMEPKNAMRDAKTVTIVILNIRNPRPLWNFRRVSWVMYVRAMDDAVNIGAL